MPEPEPEPAPVHVSVVEPTPPPQGELDGDFPDWTLGDASASASTVLMFRGNPTHTFYGTGPIAEQPELL